MQPVPGTASEGRTGKYKQVSCYCCWQQTAYSKKKCCYSATLSSWRVKLFWCRSNWGQWLSDKSLTTDFFSLREMMISMDFVKPHHKRKPCSLLRSIFWSCIGLWVKSRHRNKSTCCKSSPVQTTLQSSRSEKTTCPNVSIFFSNTMMVFSKWLVCSLSSGSGHVPIARTVPCEGLSFVKLWLHHAKAWKLSLTWFWIDHNQSLYHIGSK